MDAMERRREAIVRLVNEKGAISFAGLKEAFPQVSEMTLRTDLKALDGDKSCCASMEGQSRSRPS